MTVTIPVIKPKRTNYGQQDLGVSPSSSTLSKKTSSSATPQNIGSPPAQGAGGAGNSAWQQPLTAKQPNTSATNIPLHTTQVDGATALVLRADALLNFVTSIGANQPVAQMFNRLRLYDISEPGGEYQFGEYEGRALPVSAYMLAYLRYLRGFPLTAGTDAALANNTQKFATYRFSGLWGSKSIVKVEDVLAVQPYTGVGGLTSISTNDGNGADTVPGENVGIAKTGIARSYGTNISSISLHAVRAFMLAAGADINTGFTIRAGAKAYVPEEINDIEDRIMDFFGTAAQSLTGAASATPAGHGARGQPQDPFTGAGVFLFGDMFDQDTEITITITTAQAIQIVALSDLPLDKVITT